jgi:hypothetical protein
LAAVIFYRSSRCGSLFDLEKFKQIASWQLNAPSQLFSEKTRISHFLSKLLKAIEDCFATLALRDDESSNFFFKEEKKPNNLQAFQFLEMIFKILPQD